MEKKKKEYASVKGKRDYLVRETVGEVRGLFLLIPGSLMCPNHLLWLVLSFRVSSHSWAHWGDVSDLYRVRSVGAEGWPRGREGVFRLFLGVGAGPLENVREHWNHVIPSDVMKKIGSGWENDLLRCVGACMAEGGKNRGKLGETWGEGWLFCCHFVLRKGELYGTTVKVHGSPKEYLQI